MRGVVLVAVLAAGCGKSHHRRAAPAPDDARAPATAVVPADAATGSRTRHETTRAYARALHRGRKLADAGDYDRAIAAFRQALAATPGDARALSELGWVAFKKGDLTLADDATEKSIAAATDARLRAASLYNRGRIAEARQDSKHAVAAYEASLELRPSTAVARRLAALQGKPRKLLAPQPLAGPFPTLAKACLSLQFYRDRWVCGAPGTAGPNRIEEPSAPFTEVRIVGEDGDEAEGCRLAVRTAAGWFIGAVTSCEHWKWGDSRILALEPGPPDAGGRPTLVWRQRVKSGDRGEDRDGQRYVEWVTRDAELVCGVGSPATPACTPWIPLKEGVDGDYRYSEAAELELSVDLAPGGVVTVQKKSPEIPRDAAALIGVHQLAFP